MRSVAFLAFVAIPTVFVAVTAACGGDPPPVAEASSADFYARSGLCGVEGATRECHVNMGQRDGTLACMIGTQQCVGRLWTACGGPSVTVKSVSEAVLRDEAAMSTPTTGGGVSPLTLGEVSNLGKCTIDPCNPYCRQLGDDASTIAEAGLTVLYTFAASEWGNAPSGFIDKQDCSPSCGTGFPKSCNGGQTHYNKFDACQAEHHCDTATGNCVHNVNPSDWRWPYATCPGIDLTAGPACAADAGEGFLICNRGNTAMAVSQGPIPVFMDTGDGYNFGTGGNCISKPASCSIALTEPLAPGDCRRVTEAECPAWGNGNKIIYVNSDQSVPECGGATAGLGATMPGCNNNWSDIKKGNIACQSATIGGYVPYMNTQSTVGKCPIDHYPRWSKLVYDVDVPSGTKIEFAIQLKDLQLDGGLATATWPSVDSYRTLATETATKNCAVGGPAGCPVNLYAAVGGVPVAAYETAAVRIVVTPDVTGTITPTLKSWSISYDCLPLE